MHPEKGELRRSRLIMGTVVEIVVEGEGEDSDLLNAALDEAFAEIERLDKLLSSYRQDSDVSLLSQSRTGRLVAPETAEVIALGLEVAHRSDGAFDLGNGWRNSPGAGGAGPVISPDIGWAQSPGAGWPAGQKAGSASAG